MIALEKMHAFAAQHRRLLGGFDALGHGEQVQAPGEADEMAQEDLVARLFTEIAHEGSVDLYRIDAKRLKGAQRGKAGAEIVERDAAAEIAQGGDEARRL